ncbi:DUF2497 domain-containing protein [Jiella sp. M17.18]|uniref:DUF2497 domain-containing protein n=1 Tax=Jiella sp. M17.18 TaxID=3234247 RepID=UPI0034DEC160
MSNALPVREQSMDEILASIRRIIESGDDRLGKAGAAASGGASVGAGHASATVRAMPQQAEQAAGKAAEAAPGLVSPATSPEAESIRPAPQADGRAAMTGLAAPAAQPQARPRAAWPPAALAEQGETRAQVTGEDGMAAMAAGETDLSVARLRAVSLAAASQVKPAEPEQMPEPQGESPRETVARVSANTPHAIRRSAEPAAELPEWPSAVAANDRPAGSGADAFLAEFDEQEFATELLGKAGLIDAPDVEPEAEVEPEETGEDFDAEAVQDLSDEALLDAADEPVRVAHALISQEAGARVAASFSSLAATIREEHLRDVDGIVREMLRPMLQEWLDDNLPRMVERLVREEIERVARGGAR